MERKQTTMQRYGKRTVIKLVKKKKKKQPENKIRKRDRKTHVPLSFI
jgi:hypothetical protein